jgi:hypothetical protein
MRGLAELRGGRPYEQRRQLGQPLFADELQNAGVPFWGERPSRT